MSVASIVTSAITSFASMAPPRCVSEEGAGPVAAFAKRLISTYAGFLNQELFGSSPSLTV